MSRVSRLLQAAGLVEKEPENTAGTTSEYGLDAAPPTPPAVVLEADDSLKMAEGIPAEEIYTDAGLVEGPYPVERMIKMLAGLAQMDVASRRVAVEAMDAADDTWTIGDVLADAQSKIQALTAYRGQIEQLRRAIGVEVERRVASSQEEKTAKLADIDRQIAELQTQREQTLSDNATLVAQLRGQDLAAEDAAAREKTRLDEIIKQISGVVSLFPSPANGPASTSN